MLRLTNPLIRALSRVAILAAVACVLAGCAPAPDGPPILVSTPTTGVIAVSAVGATNVRFLHVRGGSIVLLRTVFLPPGERVQSVTWSDDERDALIATSSKVLALDTKTWRIESIARLAAKAQDDAGVDGRR
jgi:hypothetical protein